MPSANRHLAAVSAVFALGALAPAASTARSHSASAQDETYLKSSIQGDRFEIAGGQLALRVSRNPAVIALSQRLIKDHTKSLAESIKTAHALGVSIPKGPTPSQQWELEIVGTLTAGTFDHWYSLLEVKDHTQDISETQDEIKGGTSATLRQGARSDLPKLRAHLKLARAALKASP